MKIQPRQGMEGRDMEVRLHLGTESGEESNMDATDIYTGNKLVVFIDLRSMGDNKLHDSWF